MYTLDGGAPQPYGGPFTVEEDGEHTIAYRSIDGAGNAEGFKSVDFKVDASAPRTTARTSPRGPVAPTAGSTAPCS